MTVNVNERFVIYTFTAYLFMLLILLSSAIEFIRSS